MTLHAMLNICFENGIEHELLFNGKKSAYIVIGNLFNSIYQNRMSSGRRKLMGF